VIPFSPLCLRPDNDWLIGPAELAAIAADDALLDALAAGEVPDDAGPLGRRLAAWLREIEDVEAGR
jgi:hypothetical protein